MTIIEAINKIDSLKPNNYSQEEKVGWLSTIDGRIKAEIIDTHEDGDGGVFNGYDSGTSLSTELLVTAPYDELYIRWLESQIDYANGEYGKYNNVKSMFNTAYSDFERHYNRTHMPKGNKLKYF